MKYYSAVIFDCDGVVLDSNQFKIGAFREVLSSYPAEVVDEFIQYHRAHGGISRYVKFKVFFSEFLKEFDDEDQIERLIDHFGHICKRLYLQADLTPGCHDVLETLSKVYPLYVASGSDEAELREVFSERNLSSYFKSVFGAPKTKSECLEEIIRLENSAQLLFVGDSQADWDAAREKGLPFVFMARFSDAKEEMLQEAKKYGFPVIDTLEELEGLL